MSERVLPEGWVETTLGQVVEYGKAEKATRDQVDDNTWVLELEDIEKSSSKILQRLTFSERQFKSTKNRFKKGDVLYSKLRPYLDKVVMAERDGVCTTEIVPIDARPHLDNRYLFYWLKSPEFLAYVNEVGYGVNMPRLGTKDGKAAPFVLAPQEEQKAIADKLNELLAQVNNLKARLDAIPAILKRFRKSVLQAAVCGNLTEIWRLENEVENIRVVVDFVNNIKKGRLKVKVKKGCDHNLKLFPLPCGWSWFENHKLAKDSGNAICAGPFGTIFKAKDFRDEGVPIIFLRHVKERGFNQNNPKYMDEAVWEVFHKEYSVFGGELLVTKLGDPPGESCIYPAGSVTAMVTPDVLKMDVDERVANAKYLMHYFNSPVAKKMVGDMAFGATRMRIDISMFKTIPIPMPPRDEQNEIVRRVDQLFAFAGQVEQQVANAQARVNKLTQSILAKAFRGELTVEWRAANPELISGENSAETLLKITKMGKVN